MYPFPNVYRGTVRAVIAGDLNLHVARVTHPIIETETERERVAKEDVVL